jgi:sugar-specific transcriptional regulator TrmB
MNPRLDPQIIQQQIAELLIEYPELAEDEILRADMIEGETQAIEFLAEIVRRLEDTASLRDGVSERIRELTDRKSRFERRVEALRSMAFKVMNTADLKKVELPTATLSIRTGAPQVVIYDSTSLPADCLRIKTEPDKTAIKEKLKAGGAVPGAYLSNSEPTLSIRVK